MDANDYAARLEATAPLIAALARPVTADQARWRPAPDAWSILEVINHLADEEREDFRTRLDVMLHEPERPLPPIDPQGWVSARAYNQRDPAESLARFLTERERSVTWLRDLTSPEWSRGRTTPFPLRAGDLLASWAAHDLLHLRQLVELRYGLLAREAAPYQVEYAGPW